MQRSIWSVFVGVFVVAESVLSAPVLIENVTLIAMNGEVDAVANQDVLADEGIFVAIGDHGSLDVPDDAARVDGRGKWLIPGLGDAHVHYPYQPGGPSGDGTMFAQENAEVLNKLFVAHGVTFVRNMGGSPNVLEIREQIAGGEAVGPTIMTVGPMLSGSDAGVFRTLGPDADAAAIVQEHLDAGYDAIKIHTSPDPDAFAALSAEARRRGVPIVGHIPFTVGYSTSLEKLDTIEHIGTFGISVSADDAPGTGEPWPAMMERYNHPDPAKIDALAEQIKAADTVLVPTLAVTTLGAMTSEQFREHVESDDFATLTTPAIREHWIDRWTNEIGMYERAGIELAGQRDTPRLILERFVSAGVSIVAGTDAPATPMIAGRSLHAEIAAYADAGMTPRQALASATSDLADAMGRGERFGRIAVGLRADAVLLDADPLADIANTTAIRGVLLRGDYLDRSALDGLLRNVETIATADDH